MWKQIIELIKAFFTVADKLKKLDAQVMEHSEQIRNLADAQARMYYESQLQRERDARERERENFARERALLERDREMEAREKETLRLENQLLRERLERLHLPPAPPADQKSDVGSD